LAFDINILKNGEVGALFRLIKAAITIGMLAVAGARFSAVMNSLPLIFGICMSVMIMEGRRR
jgi:hypothetical protein